MPSPQQVAIGLDVGGTFLKAGLVRADGSVLGKQSIPSEADGGVGHMIDRMAGLIDQLRAEYPACAVSTLGVGMPGTLSHREGVVFNPPNLPGWKDVPIVHRLSARLGMPVVLENDANCAALGELRCGAGRGLEHMVLLTLGTGVGGGIILNGKLWRGADDFAGEWGHTVVHIGGRPCNCGQRGCLEAYASATATTARLIERLHNGEASTLRDAFARGETLTTQRIAQAARDGDRLCSEVWRETCDALAAACINIQHALNPQAVILAGGMSQPPELLLPPLQSAIDAMASPRIGRPPKVMPAALGNDAGFIGAALLAMHPDG